MRFKIDALNEKINNAVSKKFDDAKSQMDDASAKIERTKRNHIGIGSDERGSGYAKGAKGQACRAEDSAREYTFGLWGNEQKSQLENNSVSFLQTSK